jgi:hypothetical protein
MKLLEAFNKVPKELYGCFAVVREKNYDVIGGAFATIRNFGGVNDYEVVDEKTPFNVYDGFYKRIVFEVRKIK